MHAAANFKPIIGMFLMVLVLHYLARRLSLPPAASLIVGGCATAFAPGLQEIAIDPELVLVVFLPPPWPPRGELVTKARPASLYPVLCCGFRNATSTFRDLARQLCARRAT